MAKQKQTVEDYDRSLHDKLRDKINKEQKIFKQKQEDERIKIRNRNIIFFICSMALILFSVIPSIYWGNMQFDYELNKCSKMSSATSSYDFTNRIEIDAQYNDRCYYLQYHPLARFSEVFGATAVVALLLVFFLVMLYLGLLMGGVFSPKEEYSMFGGYV